MRDVGEATTEGRGRIRHAKVHLLAERACRRLRYQLVGNRVWFWDRRVAGGVVVVLGDVRVRSLDLDETLGANVLVAAAGAVQVWWVVHEADGALDRILIENRLDGPAVDEPRRVVGLEGGGHVGQRGVSGR